ncbi:MAG: polysaccharide pyruvyl transferase family protein [Clostridia bacterium]|nr:polysaccharide pyruvyl transferase family protein [Clostridia bacterium]
MPRAGVMSFLHNGNYGSILQAYALERVIESLHVEVEHIDYVPNQKEKLKNLITCGNSPSLIFEGMRKRSVPGAQARAEALDAFRKRKLHLSERCHNHEDLVKIADHYDVLIAGSDQIWSPSWLNPAYFLDFSETKAKIAYACSLGVKTMPGKRKAELMASLLSQFQSISVREDEGAELIHQMTGRPAEVLPDPVLLLTPEEWLEFGEQAERGNGKLLCYMIGSNPQYWDRVRRTAELLELEPLVIPMTEESRAQKMECIDGLSPEGFVGLFAGSSYVITDSFHGAMFSTIFSKQHTVLRRYDDSDKESKNSRIDQIQRLLGYVSMDACRPDNWTAQLIADLRKKGLEYLEVAFSLAGV